MNKLLRTARGYEPLVVIKRNKNKATRWWMQNTLLNYLEVNDE